MAYLICNDLAVGYAGKAVVRGITLEVASGDMLCIVGENGAGKSTLVKTILGLLAPVAGEVRFGDGVTADEVGYLPQRGESQRDFPASAWEIALSGRLPRIGGRPFFNRHDRELAEAALVRVGAGDLRDAPFSTLSGGQQQRVLLARALCAASKLIVLDEPTTGLDPDAAASLYETLDDLLDQGLGIITVSHDVDEAASHASKVLVLAAGKADVHAAVDWRSMRGGAA